jgi:hypothetical protein
LGAWANYPALKEDNARSIRGGADSALLKGSWVKPLSFFAAAAGAIAAVILFAGASQSRIAAAAVTPPPTPPAIGAPATPQVTASTPPQTSIAPRPSPPSDSRKGLDGVWEVQIQHPNGTDYTHFLLTQQGDALTGTYLDARGKKYPLTGTVDGQAVRVIVAMPNGTSLLLEGKLDGTTDMIGMLTTPDGQLPFTAAYRAKSKWIENVNPSPGGVPSNGTYTPP